MLPLLLGLALASDFPDLQTGDLVFQESRSDQSAALKIVTGSRYTHVGLIEIVDGTPVVIEAVEPVQVTPLADWVRRGVDGHAVFVRPDGLTAEQGAKAAAHARTWLGRHYDLGFRWSDDTLYCSELAYKALAEAGLSLVEPRTHTDYAGFEHPEVQRHIRQRYPEGLPEGEPVVAPVDLLVSDRVTRLGEVP